MTQLICDLGTSPEFPVEQNNQNTVRENGSASKFGKLLTGSMDKEKKPAKHPQDKNTEIGVFIPGNIIPASAQPEADNASKPVLKSTLSGNSQRVDEPESIEKAQLPSEILTAHSMNVGKLKNILLAGKQPVTLNLELIQEITGELSAAVKSLLAKAGYVGESKAAGVVQEDLFKALESAAPAKAGDAAENPRGGVYRSSGPDGLIKQATGAQEGSLSKDKASSAKIIFTVDKLFGKANGSVPVKLVAANGQFVDGVLSFSELKELVDEYPEKFIMEIKPASPDSVKMNSPGGNSSRQLEMTFPGEVRNMQVVQEKHLESSLVFDLHSLLAKDDSGSINVIHKSVNNNFPPAPVTESDFVVPLTASRDSSQAVDNEKSSAAGERHNETAVLRQNDHTETAKVDSGLQKENEPIMKGSHLKNTRVIDIKPSGQKQVTGTEPVSAKSESKPARIKTPKEDDINIKAKAENRAKLPGRIQLGKSGSELQAGNKPANDTLQHVHNQSTVLPETDTNTQLGKMMQAGKPIGKPGIPAMDIIGQLKSSLVLTPDNTRMIIKLKPDTLGKIDVHFKYDDSKVEALFRVDNPKVKHVLEAEAPRLKADWKIDNLRIEMSNRQTPAGFADSNRSFRGQSPEKPSAERFPDNQQDIKEGGEAQAEPDARHRPNVYGGKIDLMA